MVEPRLSVVATSRNDDHGGHLVERMQWFVDGVAWNARRSGLATELVMVEWNPPDARPPIAEVLRWPDESGSFSVRVLTVPPDEHRRLVGPHGIPMMQMIAKNVGVRRARGANVLATNIDILLAPSLFDLAASRIGTGVLWRADRYDVEFPFSADVGTVDEALEFCSAHPVRYERRDGVYYPGVGRRLPIYQGVGDFVAWQGSRVANRLRRIAGGRHESGSSVGSARSPGAPASATSAAGEPPTLAAHRPSGTSARELAAFAADRIRAFGDLVVLPKLNVNACGDFTLLSHADWALLRGYPEWVVHSLHLDTVFMHQAQAAGLTFVDVEPPSVAYHMEHAAGSGWTPEAQAEHLAGVTRAGMPHITPERLREEKRSLLAARRRGELPVYNAPDWGLVDSEVAEWTPSHPGRPEGAAKPSRARQTGGDISSGTATTS